MVTVDTFGSINSHQIPVTHETHGVTGGMVEHAVCERVCVAWGAGAGGAGTGAGGADLGAGGAGSGGELVWSGGGGALRMMRDDFYAAIRDISYVMRTRATTDYGLKVSTVFLYILFFV